MGKFRSICAPILSQRRSGKGFGLFAKGLFGEFRCALGQDQHVRPIIAYGQSFAAPIKVREFTVHRTKALAGCADIAPFVDHNAKLFKIGVENPPAAVGIRVGFHQNGRGHSGTVARFAIDIMPD